MQDAQYHNDSNPVNFISVEAEQSVIGGLMLNNAAWAEVSEIISTKDFAQSRHQKIFAVMKSLVKQNSPIDPVTVAAKLQKKKGAFEAVGGSQYLGHLAGNTPSTANIVAYAKIVKERCIQRNIEAAYKNKKSGAVILDLEKQLNILNLPDSFNESYNWDLLPDADLPDPQFLVDNLITEGVVLLAGSPKARKSFFALNLGMALAGGGEFLGRSLEKAGVLYLALEDTQRRIRQRSMPMVDVGGLPRPTHLEIVHEWTPLGMGGEEQFERHLEKYPETRLIMIDTLAKLRPASSGANMYQEDYQTFNKLTNITKKHPGLTILVLHHVRKTKTDDVFESISGSNGIFGAVDSALILGTNSQKSLSAKLHITGRDIEEQRDDDAVVMKFDGNCLMWKVSDEAISLGNCDDDAILDAIKNGVHSPINLADYTGIGYGIVGKRLLYLTHDLNKVIAVKRGYYELAEQTEQSDKTVIQQPKIKNPAPILDNEPFVLRAEQTEQTGNENLAKSIVSYLSAAASNIGNVAMVKVELLTQAFGITIDVVMSIARGNLHGVVSIYGGEEPYISLVAIP